MEESPAISPDGKTVALVARNGRRRQVWIGSSRGMPVQIMHDAADHEQPPWTSDAGSLIYYSPPEPGDQGTIWEIPALATRIANRGMHDRFDFLCSCCP